MNQNFHERLDEKAAPLPSDRSTGLVLATALLIAAILFRADIAVAGVALGLSLVLSALSLSAPLTLRPLNRAWMAFGHALGRIVSPVVMFVVYCLTIVPFGIAMQFRNDPLRQSPTGAEETFWIVPEISFGPDDMKRQF
jgi:hypothetical protein